MEAVPRMPMIWLELKEAGDFHFSPAVKQYIRMNYGENPEDYSEALNRLEVLRKIVVNIPRDFEGCSTLRKYCGQLQYLQGRVPMAGGQEAARPVTWADGFTGRSVTHEDVRYEQACVLYNLGALHSILGAVDNRRSEEGMKVSCTHFQCSAGAFAFLRDHYNHGYSSDLSTQALSLNISLMLAQAQECLLEKTLLDNRKNHLVAKISAQVCDYYKDCLRILDHSDCVPGRIQKEWKKLISIKICYFSAITHLHMGKQSEEQQKHGESVAFFQSSLDKLNEAIRQSKGMMESVQEALKFTMDVIGGKYNSAKKDNEFIYHETVPGPDSLAAVKGASLVKALPVTLTDPSVTGPDLFSKLVPMATHEASSLYSEEKAMLLRGIVAKIEEKNQILQKFMESLGSDSVYKIDIFKTVPDALLEKCAFLSVRPDTVKKLVQAMQALSSVYTDVGSSLGEIHSVLEEDEAEEKSLLAVVGQKTSPSRSLSLQEIQQELQKYEAAHQAASQANTELHKAMNQHIPNLRLLQGSVEDLRKSLPQPQLGQDDMALLHKMKTLLDKVDEMRKQRLSLESQLRELIHKDDITGVLVTVDRGGMKTLFAEQLRKYDQLTGYIEQNLAAQDNILRALTETNVQYAPVRKALTVTEQEWSSKVQVLLTSFEVYEDLLKKAEEGRDFYQDLDKKTSSLLDKAKSSCQTREAERVAVLERETGKNQPLKTATQKPVVGQKVGNRSGPSSLESVGAPNAPFTGRGDLSDDLRGLAPSTNVPRGPGPQGGPPLSWPHPSNPFAPSPFPNSGTDPKQFGHPLPHPRGIPSSAPLQFPNLPQTFPQRSAGGVTSIYPQVNPSTASQGPAQAYNAALWMSHRGPVAISGSYEVPPSTGQMSLNPFLPGPPGPQVSIPKIGQQVPSAISACSSGQVMQGPQYQSPSITPRSALPSFAPGQFQHGPAGPMSTPLPQAAFIPGHAQAQYLSNPFLQPPLGNPVSSLPSSHPQQLSAPVQPGSQVFPQMPFSQNSQMPFVSLPSSQAQLQARAVPSQRIMPFVSPYVSQPVPPQFNPMISRPGPSVPPNQFQSPGPQNLASSSPQAASAPVLDNPVPPSLGVTLTPTPSSAPLPPAKGNVPQETCSDSTVPESIQNKMNHLSIDPPKPNSDEVDSKETVVQSESPQSQPVNGEQEVQNKDQFGDLDPLWSAQKN